jgi:YggT family protein
MKAVVLILLQILNIATWIIVIQAVLSWLVMFKVLDVRNSVVGSIWGGLERLTEPLYRPVRKLLPPMSGIDITPLIVILFIQFLSYVLTIYIFPNVP